MLIFQKEKISILLLFSNLAKGLIVFFVSLAYFPLGPATNYGGLNSICNTNSVELQGLKQSIAASVQCGKSTVKGPLIGGHFGRHVKLCLVYLISHHCLESHHMLSHSQRKHKVV